MMHLRWAFNLLLMTCGFFISHSEARENCRTEIRVNDSMASISIDGMQVGTSHYIANCKEEPQTVVIVASDKRAFTRVLPGAADFNPHENFWNVRLQSYLYNSIASEGRDLAQVLLEIGQLRQTVNDLKKSALAPSNLHPVSPASEVPSPKREIAANPINNPVKSGTEKSDSIQMQLLKGIFVQVEAIPGMKAPRDAAAERLKELHASLNGMQVTMCPTHVAETAKDWTKVLVGPVSNKNEAQKLTKLYGQESFIIRDPMCEKNSTVHFQIEQ
jgi:hypothetical protein